MPLSAEQLRLLGEIVARGAMVEGLAATAIGYLIMGPRTGDSSIDHATYMLTDGQQAHWLFDRLDRLAERVEDPIRERIRAWVRQARVALDERNSLVHSMWIGEVQDAAIGLRNRPRGPIARLASEREFAAALELMRAAQLEGRRMVGVLGGEAE